MEERPPSGHARRVVGGKKNEVPGGQGPIPPQLVERTTWGSGSPPPARAMCSNGAPPLGANGFRPGAKGPGGHAVPRGAWATDRGAGAAGKGQGRHSAFDQACTHLRLRFRLVLREFQRARLLRFRECARSRRARFFVHPPALLFLGSGEVRSGGNAAQRERGSSGPCTGCGARTTGARSLPRICL